MNCVICGKEIISDRKNVKVCSLECHRKRDRETVRKYKSGRDMKTYQKQIRQRWKESEEQRKKEFLDFYYMVNVTRRKT